MKKPELIIGTRGSDLALWQANLIATKLAELGHKSRLRVVKTAGDKDTKSALSQLEGKAFFTKEIEDALLDGSIDLAVHSLKDLMTVQPEGLTLGAVGFREDRRELLLIRPESAMNEGLIPVKDGATIGTGSTRRASQIHHHNPSLVIKDLRGNVPTRINKLRDGLYDAIIIAAAGVKRLSLDTSDLENEVIEPSALLPAPGQGILAIQVRTDDKTTAEAVRPLNCPLASIEAALERGLLARFDSGCSLPLGVYSEINGDEMRLKATLGIQVEGHWTGQLETDITGQSVDDIVDRAYNELSQS
jgi:hydroxymethylbilane synthase